MRESDAAYTRRVSRTARWTVFKDADAARTGTDNSQKIRARSGDRQTVNARRRTDLDDRCQRDRLRRVENSRVKYNRVRSRRRVRVQDRLAQTARAAVVRVRHGKCCRRFEAVSADFMSLEITDFTKDFTPEEKMENSLVGQKIGIYEIVGELGFGGMGAVYLAERADGKFAQKVAVKMLRREFNTEQIRRNFKREKEILAKLDHPFIARLLDAGKSEDGIPFLVMEYVEGLPIDQFCENENLSLTERLKLFNKVGEAVSFAHQNLIIHRDLKPSNIIVTKSGEPKLLDFGISKLLDAEDAENKTALTLLGAMTPEYASPEQIKGEIVTTATDIYSLGVVLYKILTNNLPFQSKGKTNSELLKAITEDEPTAPSIVSSLESEVSNSESPQSAIKR